MTKTTTKLMLLLAVASVSFLSSCKKEQNEAMPSNTKKTDLIFYALCNTNQLLKYNSNEPEKSLKTSTITGVIPGDKIIAIDFRPATGQLYGLGSNSRLYVINYETAVATVIGSAPFSPAINGAVAGFDFNPTVDRIRLVTVNGQNLRLNPETGAAAATDGNLNPGTPAIAAVAYTNNMAGAATTSLFDIDVKANKLFKQDPPNNGTLVEVGSLGITADEGKDAGFDISPDNKLALATIYINGVTNLYQIDLATGKADKLGKLSININGIAIPTAPVAYAVDLNNNLQIFNFTNAGTPVSKMIGGLQAGENILGIDMRPATGQLFAIGSSSRLYAINMASGAATAIGAGPLATLLTGTSFGFDFNPTVDRIRLISNLGTNLRLNPNDGTLAATDGALNPGSPMVSGAAYTNNFAGATSTVLFDIDPATDKLYTQIPPNNGTLVEVGSLGIDVETDNGFDIGGISNKAYAMLTVAGATKIYMINTTTGAATAVSSFPNAVRGFAIGLGF